MVARWWSYWGSIADGTLFYPCVADIVGNFLQNA